jgi:hypothetical protein
MKKLFLDLNEDVSKTKIKEYRAQGLPDCLIVQKDNNYFTNYVAEHRVAFLRFFVEGAMQYYKTETIPIPASLNAQQLVQTLDKPEAVQAYALEHLCICEGEKTSLREITQHFRDTTKIQSITLKNKAFATLLRAATLEMGPEWTERVKYHLMRVKADVGMGYLNVTFSDRLVGIQKFAEITDRYAQVVDKESVVKAYIKQHLEICKGEEIYLHEVLAHFRAISPTMKEHITDKMFSNKFMNYAHTCEEWDDLVRFAKMSKGCEKYKNLKFVNAKVEFLYKKKKSSPETSSKKRNEPES